MTNERLPIIDMAQAIGSYHVRPTWGNGTVGEVDLAETVYRLHGLRNLRDPDVFAQVRVGRVWPRAGMAWRHRHGRRQALGLHAKCHWPR